MIAPVPEVIFVCYGNICRSPIAEALLQKATPAEIQATGDPVLRQFIEGSSEGPLLPT